MKNQEKVNEICTEIGTTEEELQTSEKALLRIVKQCWNNGDVDITSIVNAIHDEPFQPRVKLWMAFKLAESLEALHNPFRIIESMLK